MSCKAFYVLDECLTIIAVFTCPCDARQFFKKREDAIIILHQYKIHSYAGGLRSWEMLQGHWNEINSTCDRDPLKESLLIAQGDYSKIYMEQRNDERRVIIRRPRERNGKTEETSGDIPDVSARS